MLCDAWKSLLIFHNQSVSVERGDPARYWSSDWRAIVPAGSSCQSLHLTEFTQFRPNSRLSSLLTDSEFPAEDWEN